MKLFDLDERWGEWLATRPEAVRNLAQRFPPNVLYENKQVPGQRWTVVSYWEDGTMSMLVSSEHNEFVIMDREVFGVPPEDVAPVGEIVERGEP